MNDGMEGTRPRGRAAVVVVVAVAVAAASLAVPVGASAPTTIDGCRTVDRPGEYVLGGDITDGSADACLRIVADGVTIDGGGHTVDGVDDEGIGVHVVESADAVVRDLAVANFRRGVVYEDTDGGEIAGVTARGSARNAGFWFEGATRLTVADSTASSNAVGIYVTSLTRNVTVRDSAVRGNDDGIRLTGGSADNRLVGLEVESNVYRGIWIGDDSHRTTLSRTNVSGSRVGIRIETRDNVLTDTVVSDGHTGIVLAGADGSALAGTTVTGTTDGIRATDSDGLVLNGGRVSGVSGDAVSLAGTTNARLDGLTVRDGPVAAGASAFTAEALNLSSALVDVSGENVTLAGVPTPPGGRPAGTDDVGSYVNVTAAGARPSATVTFRYADADARGVDEASLRAFGHDGTWTEAGGTPDPAANTVTANLPVGDATVFAPFGDLSGTVLSGCGNVTEPGHYTLAGDVDGTGETTCLTVSADDVTIDGAGRALRGGDDPESVGLAIDARTNVTVEDISVSRFGTGVAASNAADVRLVGVNASQNAATGIEFRNASGSLDGVVANGNGEAGLAGSGTGSGIRLRDAAVDIRNAEAVGNVDSAVHATGDLEGSSVSRLDAGTATLSLAAFGPLAVAPEPAPPEDPQGHENVGAFVNLTATGPGAYADLELAYAEAALGDRPESGLALWHHDGRSWTRLDHGRVDQRRNVVAANVTEFSTFAPLVNETAGGGGDGGAGDGESGNETGGDAGDGTTGGDGAAGRSGGAVGAGGGGGTTTGTGGAANLSVVAADLATETASAGERVTVRGVVENTGDAAGELRVRLFVDGRDTGESRLVEVPAGERRTVTVTERFREPGEFDVALNDVFAGRLAVTGSTAAPATPTRAGTATDGPKGGAGTPGPTGPGDDATAPPGGTTGNGFSGAALGGAAVIAVLITAYYVRARGE